MGLRDSFQKRQSDSGKSAATTNVIKIEGFPTEADLVYVSDCAKTNRLQLQVLVWPDETGLGEYHLNVKSALTEDVNEHHWALNFEGGGNVENYWGFPSSDVALIYSLIEAAAKNAASSQAQIPDSLKPPPQEAVRREVYPTEAERPRGPYADSMPVPQRPRQETSTGSASSGTLLDRYEVMGEIGRGAMGIVYAARQKMTERMVAIKALHAHLIEDELSLARFQREVLSTCKMNHPNCVLVFDCDVAHNGQPFLVMEYVEGTNLKNVFEDGPVPFPRYFDLFMQCAEGLAHAHTKGIIHRDLKPSNIMIVRDERGQEQVKLVDFGVAKIATGKDQTHSTLTRQGEAVGSPRYMSPEQCMGEETDWRSDIYALGCVMCEGLVGRPPFVAENAYKVMHAHIHQPPPRLAGLNPDVEVPPDLEELIHIMLAKNPADRPDSALDVASVIGMIRRNWIYANQR